MSETNEIESDCPYQKLDDTQGVERMTAQIGSQKKVTQSVIFALLAGLWFAIGNYIIGGGSNLGFIAVYAANVGNMVCAILYYGYFVFIRVYNNKPIWTWKESYYRHPEGGVNFFNILMLCSYSFVNIVAYWLVVYWFKFSLNADVNQGIISSLFGLSAFFTAVGAYLLFDERLKVSHMIGIVLMIICVIGIGFSSSNRNIMPKISEMNLVSEPSYLEAQGSKLDVIPIEIPESQNNTEYAILSIIFGILCPISFCLASIIIKIADRGPKIMPVESSESVVKFNKFHSTDLTTANYVTTNFVTIICSIITFQVGSYAFNPSEYFQIAIGGFVCSLGVIFINYALVIGYSGPVFALSNMQVIIQSVLDVIFLSQFPSLMQVIACLFGIAGAVIMAIF